MLARCVQHFDEQQGYELPMDVVTGVEALREACDQKQVPYAQLHYDCSPALNLTL